jgi:hypothetical protein
MEAHLSFKQKLPVRFRLQTQEPVKALGLYSANPNYRFDSYKSHQKQAFAIGAKKEPDNYYEDINWNSKAGLQSRVLLSHRNG